MKLKDVKVGGIDGGIVQVPDGYTHGDLTLERGMIEGSFLINWLEIQIATQRKIPIPVIVTLLDGNGLPSYCWFFINAYPIKWETSGFNADSSGLVIEKITFKYLFYKQVNMTLMSSMFSAVMGARLIRYKRNAMPIEIRELLIRTTIESNDATKKTGHRYGAKPKTETAASPAAEKGKLKEQLVRECVNVIMDNLSAYNKER